MKSYLLFRQIFVTYPDGTPAAGKLISLSCSTDQGKIFDKNFTSLDMGAIEFAITDINITSTSLNLYVSMELPTQLCKQVFPCNSLLSPDCLYHYYYYYYFIMHHHYCHYLPSSLLLLLLLLLLLNFSMNHDLDIGLGHQM